MTVVIQLATVVFPYTPAEFKTHVAFGAAARQVKPADSQYKKPGAWPGSSY